MNFCIDRVKKVIRLSATLLCSYKSLNLIFALVAISIALSGCSARSKLDVDGKEIIVPVPEGYVPLGDRVPDYRSFAVRHTFGYKLIEQYLTKSEMNDVVAGDSKIRDRILNVLTPPALGGVDFPASEFQGAKIVIRDHAGAKSQSMIEDGIHHEAFSVETTKDLRAAEKVIPNPNSQWLGVYFETANSIGETRVISHPGSYSSRKVIVNVTMRVRNRYVVLECRLPMINDDDRSLAQDICKRWSEVTLNANVPPASQ